jgi:hypothetical protein
MDQDLIEQGREQELNEELKQLRLHVMGMIERKDPLCYEVADESCQIFENVKHMSWFVFCVGLEVTRQVKSWEHLNDYMENKALKT